MIFLVIPIQKNIKPMKKIALVLFLAFVGVNSQGFAQNPKVVISDKKGWHKIGETTVDFSKEKDEIAVIGADKFASLVFKVTDAPINIMDIDVYFEDGTNQKVNMNMPIKAPGQSKEVNFTGGEKDIKKIVFVYKTVSNNKDEKAHVEIWGSKTNADKDKTATN
jgi:hypothetical protein